MWRTRPPPEVVNLSTLGRMPFPPRHARAHQAEVRLSPARLPFARVERYTRLQAPQVTIFKRVRHEETLAYLVHCGRSGRNRSCDGPLDSTVSACGGMDSQVIKAM